MLDTFKRATAILAVLSIVSCGGGGGDNYVVGANGGGSTNDSSDSGGGTTTDTGDETTGGDTTTTPDSRIADLEISASSRQLGSNGSEPVIISAIVKDVDNNILKDIDVKFSVDNNGTIEPDEGNISDGATEGATGGSAVKTAKLTPGLNRPENRTLVVTVTAGEQVRTIDIEVAGTTVQLDGPERIVINTPTQFVAKLKDSSGKGLPYQVMSIASTNNNTIDAVGDQGFSTDQDGEIAFEITALSSGTDTLTATALGATFSHEVAVSGDDFALSSVQEEINVDTEEAINLIWTRDNVAQSNKLINLTATRGLVPASVTTDTTGKASFMLSSATAGGTVVTATDAETGLTASLVREFVAIAPKYMSVQSEQGNIGPEGQTTVFALVRDVNDNPVKNQKVTFNLVYDTVNGKLSSSIATTDSLGRASVVYTAGNASSAKDGIHIEATLQDNPAITDNIHLTVGDRALQIVLGHDETLIEEGIFYKKMFGVVVTDSGGNPVADQSIDFTLNPTKYYKGRMECPESSWGAVYTAPACAAEDIIIDNGLLDDNEDYNGNGRLDPTHTATVTTKAVTDSDGKATVEVIYPQSEALWSEVDLTATAAVGGTEYIENIKFSLPILASDVSSCDTSPPNQRSPYGQANQCESPD